MIKVLVTGGNGFLGSSVVKALEKRKKKYQVYSCSRSSGVDMRNYSEFEQFLSEIKPRVVIHCAAHVGGIAYNSLKPVQVFEDNLYIGLNVVKACNTIKVKYLLNIMPNCVYPGHLELYEEKKWWDGAMHKTVLTYGLPRKMVWGACFAYNQQFGFNKALHLVFPNMYGPGDHFDPVRSHALGALIAKITSAKIEHKKTVKIWGTGKPIREWIYVKDAAQAVALATEDLSKFANNDIVNIGTGKGISIADMAYLIKEAVGWKGNFIFDTSKPNGAMKKVLAVEKMKNILNWQPSTPLKRGIKQTVSWYIKKI